MLPERGLQRVSSPSPARPSTVSIVRPSACTASSRQERTATPSRRHRAGAADAVLAADVRARQPERVAEEVGEQQPRLDLLAVEAAVDGRPRRRSRRPPTRSARRGDGPLDEDARQVLQVRGRGVDAPVRIDRGRSGLARLAGGLRVDAAARQPDVDHERAIGHRAERDPSLLDEPVADGERTAARERRVVAAPLRQLLEGDPTLAAAAGQIVSTTSSSGSSVVRSARRRTRRRGSSRPLVDAATTAPPRATSASGSSAAGSAWAIEPPTVPRLRVTKWPTNGSASATSGSRSRTSCESPAAAWRASAPTGRCRSPTRSRRARRRVHVDEHGRTGQPDVQHRHEALAAGEHLRVVPASASAASASSTLVARTYSNGGRLHGSSSQTRPGVSGTSTSSRPSASATAFAIATGALIVFPRRAPSRRAA